MIKGSWSTTGSLAVARSAFTITVLSSGKVLVAGGQVDSTGGAWAATATAEIYDPSTRAWSTVAPMASPRRFACSALLPSGRVLVAGGESPANGALATAEVYDPVGNAWSATAGPMAAKRLSATCTSLGLASGQVLVSGGSHTGGVERTAELYDPATGLFTPTGSMVTGRTFHTATPLLTGQVLVVGGADVATFDTTTPSAEEYDPASGTWSDASALPGGFGVGGHTATLLPTGEVLVAGGCHVGSGSCPDAPDQRHVSLFSPGSRTWTDKGSLLIGRTLGAALLLSTGDVLIAAGDYHTMGGGTERYETATGKIGGGPGMLTSHGDRVGAAGLGDGTWLVVGGILLDGATVQNSRVAEIFTE
ncbi:MAG TPA: kelch repeat-containing protein [Anaeromyxobacteraceae bacterium]|nr:kelch repeat-containing protein [Anaeromyxobacteraceae bacterium]